MMHMTKSPPIPTSPRIIAADEIDLGGDPRDIPDPPKINYDLPENPPRVPTGNSFTNLEPEEITAINNPVIAKTDLLSAIGTNHPANVYRILKVIPTDIKLNLYQENNLFKVAIESHSPKALKCLYNNHFGTPELKTAQLHEAFKLALAMFESGVYKEQSMLAIMELRDLGVAPANLTFPERRLLADVIKTHQAIEVEQTMTPRIRKKTRFGASGDRFNEYGELPLTEAVRTCNFERIKKLSLSDVDFSERDKNGNRAIDMVCAMAQANIPSEKLNAGLTAEQKNALEAYIKTAGYVMACGPLLYPNDMPDENPEHYHNNLVRLLELASGMDIAASPMEKENNYRECLDNFEAWAELVEAKERIKLYRKTDKPDEIVLAASDFPTIALAMAMRSEEVSGLDPSRPDKIGSVLKKFHDFSKELTDIAVTHKSKTVKPTGSKPATDYQSKIAIDRASDSKTKYPS